MKIPQKSIYTILLCFLIEEHMFYIMAILTKAVVL